jgi:hypothetical protein
MLLSARIGEEGLTVLPRGASAFVPLRVPGIRTKTLYQPEFIEGGPDFLFLALGPADEERGIYLATLNGTNAVNPVRLMANDTAARYAPGISRILFVRDNTLYSQLLDRRNRRLSGEPELVQKNVASAPSFGLPAFSVSATGLLVWRSGVASASRAVAFNRKGEQVGALSGEYPFSVLRLSPDEKHLLAAAPPATGSFILDSAGTGVLKVDGSMLWSSDGSGIIGVNASRIVEVPLGRPAEWKVLAEAPGIRFLEDISPDRRFALYNAENTVRTVPLDGGHSGQPSTVVDTGEQISTPRFSPNGRWIVYSARSSQSRPLGIFVQPFGAPGLRRQVSGSGAYPLWRGDGREIVFLSAGNRLQSVSVQESGGDIRFGEPAPLFPIRLASNAVGGFNPIAISRDGSRIYFPQEPEQPADSAVIHVRTNWQGKQ